MGAIEQKLDAMGLVLPEPMQGASTLPFEFVRILGDRAVISGHVPQLADGSMAPPFGKVGVEVTLDEAKASARLATLAMLASLQRSLGDLDRITHWVRVFGMVNADPGFKPLPLVINGCSELILELFGADAGAHARSAVGMSCLPFAVPVEIEAEVQIRI